LPLKEFIESTAVFTTQDYLRACGDTQANRNLLSRAVKSGKVKRIKFGLYASNAGRYHEAIHDKYDIVKTAVSDAIFCYSSAFELLVGQHNLVFRTVFFTKSPADSFKFQGQEYKSYPKPKKAVRTRGYRLSSGSVARGTTLEQTIVDSLAQPDRCLGIENVLRTLSVISSISSEDLIGILDGATQAVRARLGWVLEQKQEQWQVHNEILDNLNKDLMQGPFYFTPNHARTKNSYDSKWKLYFPETVSAMKEWIDG
jgi:predicted transcriptional regulator of viral defense system